MTVPDFQPGPAAPRTLQVVGSFELAASEAESPSALLAEAPRPKWVPAMVPGGVHESLIASEVIGHPYYGDNEHAVRWVEDATWWYRTRFDAPTGLADDERLRLVCPALDTVASLWLNGEPLGTHASQFRPAVFDVTGRIRASNELMIRFAPPLAGLSTPPGVANTIERMRAMFGELAPDQVPGPEDEQPPGVMSANLALTLRRKGTFSWGWDFGPRLPAVGIARPVELHRDSGAVLAGHHVRTLSLDTAARTAQVAIDVEADAFAHPGPLRAEVTLTAPDGDTTVTVIALDADGDAEGDAEQTRQGGSVRNGAATVTVAEARLWWTHDLGEQPLYGVSVVLTGQDGQVLDRAEDRIGLRTVALDRSPDDEGGRLFRFMVNGVPVFARGANWVPVSMMTGSVTAGTVHALVEAAARGNMNMLRVWGGGVYEQDSFYEACDDLGILVWQDFMFACIDYPSDDPVLRAEVAKEAEYQVKRLRNHAGMALWGGNNEVHAMHGLVYGNFEPGNWGYSFFHDILPGAVERFSPEIPYWPGSPWADSDPAGVNGVADGDRHAWEVWHGVDVGAGGPTDFASKGEAVHFHRYRHDHGKFISEFGIHASPELGTLARWTPPGSLALHSAEFDHRNKDVPKNKGDDLMSVETGLPDGLDQYVDFSMACQAEGLKFGIEHYRRRQPHCSGTLLWQLNDPWPGLSWSVVDHDLIPKAGYYFAQRAYETVLTSFARHDDGRLELWVTNSGRTEVPLELRVEVSTFAGKRIVAEDVRVSAAPGSSRPVWSAGPDTYEPGPDRFAWVGDAAGRTTPNRLFFAPLKDLPLADSQVEISAGPVKDGTADITLTSHGYSYLARVLAPAPGVTFSRNYLDLRDGDQAHLTVGGLPDGFDPTTLRCATYRGKASTR
ncbi:glycoside hydrolase family 2 protein [Streptomyces sp. NPDC057137]|uniref:beta-mannosidase n=1 Tax=Streptomyces sp. NPDC057137 TaxID=3346030 RepID=UPI00362D0097